MFSWQAHISYACLHKKVLDSLLLVCTTLIESNTNIAKGNYNLQNPNICSKFLSL
jgi:hypothetical protein